MDHAGRKLASHKGSKIRYYTMPFKETVAKFPKKNFSAFLQFNVDHKLIREWVNNINEISSKKSTRNRLDGGVRKPVIIEIEENLLE